MIKSIETTGRTEEDAIAAALRELGKSREDVSVEVLERAKSGFLGIGSSPAKVRVSYEEKDSCVQRLEDFLRGLLERMEVEAEVSATYSEEEKLISVELSGDDAASIIGRRGETLDAIQHLSNFVINNGSEERVRVNVDAENYRARRAETLSALAQKTAGKVVRYRRNMTLEPMNAYERHVIHAALQDYPGVTTYSTGTEPNRRVVVAYDNAAAGGETPPPPREERRGQERGSRAPRDDRRPPRRSSSYQRPAPAEAPQKPPVDKTIREWH